MSEVALDVLLPPNADLRTAIDRKRLLVALDGSGSNVTVEDFDFAPPTADFSMATIAQFQNTDIGSATAWAKVPLTTVNGLDKNVDTAYEVADPRSGAQTELQDNAKNGGELYSSLSA